MSFSSTTPSFSFISFLSSFPELVKRKGSIQRKVVEWRILLVPQNRCVESSTYWHSASEQLGLVVVFEGSIAEGKRQISCFVLNGPQ